MPDPWFGLWVKFKTKSFFERSGDDRRRIVRVNPVKNPCCMGCTANQDLSSNLGQRLEIIDSPDITNTLRW